MTETTPRGVQIRPPRHRVQRRAIWWWMLQSALWCLPILTALIVAATFWESQRTWLLVAVAAWSLYTVATIAVEPFWRYAVHRWETNDQAVYALTGWYVREWRVAPMSRIQTVDAIRGPLEQLMGLATLRVTTASSKGAIDIGGLDAETAAEIADRLTAITQEIPGDAT